MALLTPRDAAPALLLIQEQWLRFVRAIVGDLLRLAGYPPQEIHEFLQRYWPVGDFNDS